jgi:methylenetetrahydrofolate reductase (NADPH)
LTGYRLVGETLVTGGEELVGQDCPKRMQFGPCGGVKPDGQCEMRSGPCSFDGVVPWPGGSKQLPPVPAPLVLTDFSCEPFDPADVAAIANILAPSCDAVLVGDHQNRPDFPPTLMSRLILDQGVTPWITLSCRDRNRIVLEQELVGLRFTGAKTVFCVTGDGRGYDVRPDVTQTFDLDGPRLVALAASLDMIAAVPEKQRAGASVAVLNHVSSASTLSAFMDDARTAGLRIPVLASVAVFTDVVSAAVLQGLPGLELDSALVDEVVNAPDPIEAGIETAVGEARKLLTINGIDGINLSGRASASGTRRGAEIKAEVAARIRAAGGT